MSLIFRLPFTILELVLRQGLTALTKLVGGGDDAADTIVRMPPEPSAGRGNGGGPSFTATPEAAAPPKPPTAQEAIQRRKDREAADRPAPPRRPKPQAPSARASRPAAPRPAAPTPAPEPTPLRPVNGGGHVSREATVVESFGGGGDDIGATLQVDAPWEGYDGMPANAIVSRVRGADEATKAVVRLYEQTHKKRQTVIRATG